MHDAVLMDCVQTGGDFATNADDVAQFRRARGSDPFFDRFALQPFHGQENDLVLLRNLIDRHQVLMLDGRQCAGLAQEALPGRGVAIEVGLHHLEGNPPAQGDVFSQEDVSHAPLAQEAQHPVHAQPANLVGIDGRKQE